MQCFSTYCTCLQSTYGTSSPQTVQIENQMISKLLTLKFQQQHSSFWQSDRLDFLLDLYCKLQKRNPRINSFVLSETHLKWILWASSKRTGSAEMKVTIVLDDYYLSSRDLVGKGREVHPSGKQRNISTVSWTEENQQGHLNKPFVEEDQVLAYFDLNPKPPIFISSGANNKLEPGEYTVFLCT